MGEKQERESGWTQEHVRFFFNYYFFDFWCVWVLLKIFKIETGKINEDKNETVVQGQMVICGDAIEQKKKE